MKSFLLISFVNGFYLKEMLICLEYALFKDNSNIQSEQRKHVLNKQCVKLFHVLIEKYHFLTTFIS